MRNTVLGFAETHRHKSSCPRAPAPHFVTTATPMAHLIVKVCHQGEIKRVAVNLGTPLAELRIKLATLFNLPTGTPVVLKYLDDENDLITLSEEEELVEATRLAQKNNLVLRVHMFLPNQPVPATDFKSVRTARSDVPALLSSQLPVLTNSIITSGSTAAVASSSAPVALSVIVVERHYLPMSQIGQRTASISSETSALVEKNANAVASQTALVAEATAHTLDDVARKTQLNVEQSSRPSPAVVKLADQTAGTCESISQSTSDKVSALSDLVAGQMAKQSERTAQANVQSAELDRHWAVIAADTAARVDELSAALVQRLLSL